MLTPLAKNALVPLGLTAAASATDAAIQNKSFVSGGPLDIGKWTALVFSNEDLNNIMKIVKSLEDATLLIKGVTETVQNEVK